MSDKVYRPAKFSESFLAVQAFLTASDETLRRARDAVVKEASDDCTSLCKTLKESDLLSKRNNNRYFVGRWVGLRDLTENI